MADDLKREEEFNIKLQRLYSLPKVCNALRSFCAQKNKNTFKLNEIRSRLSDELELSKFEVQSRLLLMTDVIPEFVTIFPPDDIVGVEMIRINLYAPYAALQLKLKQLILTNKSSY